MGGYISKEIRGSTCQGTSYDKINLVSFKFNGECAGGVGRFFIEVVL